MKLAQLYQREKGICSICHKKITRLEDATREHRVPRYLGGTAGENSSNLGIAHKWCNRNKGHKAFRAEQHKDGWVIVDPNNQISSELMEEVEAKAIAAQMNADKLYMNPEYQSTHTYEPDIIIIRKAQSEDIHN